jgi:hypothetical protein
MTLEERYNAAGANTYVGRVRTLQAADVGGNKPGVNFMNGEGFTGTPPAPDQVQTEFTRNNAGDFKYAGGGKVPGSPDNKYVLSRWLTKGVEKGDTYLTNTRFTTVSDVRNASTLLQRYNWLKDTNKFIGTLAEGTRGRITPATGPTPAGLQG